MMGGRIVTQGRNTGSGHTISTEAKAMETLNGVSSEAVMRATGHGWEEWLAILDQAGAEGWGHKEIVAYLASSHGLSGWWQQMVTVAYEKAKGRRVVGQTADTGFQVGVQKTIPLTINDAWALLTSPEGIAIWLGEGGRFTLSVGERYATESQVTGEVRVVKPGDRLRMTWQRPGMGRPATLQVALVGTSPGKTSVRVHLEHLPSEAFRQEMKAHWKEVLDRLARSAAPSKDERPSGS